MRLRKVVEEYKRGDVFTLYPLGDVHFGSANCDVEHFLRVVAAIDNDPNARWIGMGDMMEAIAPNDRRWRAGGMIPDAVREQDRIGDYYVDEISTMLMPIADKLWSYGFGNHEKTFNDHYYTDLSIRILERLGRPECFAGWAGMTRVQFREGNHRTAVRIFHSHGYQAGRKDGAKVNGLDDLMGYIEGADIYLQGHSHSVLVKTKVKLSANIRNCDLVSHICYGAHTGSFLKTYALGEAGYSEVGQYPPTQLGCPKFILHPAEKGVTIEAVQ